MYLDINRTKAMTLQRQVYESLRALILGGDLQAHSRLPSSRQMALINGVSRVVVVQAYEQLLAEGYLYTKGGSGTYICKLSIKKRPQTIAPVLSPRRDHIKGLKAESSDYEVDFRTGAPDLSIFPIDKWGMLYRQVCQDIGETDLDYYESRGSQVLIRSLLTYLFRTRGISADPEQVVITTGAAQAFTLSGRLLLSPGDRVVIEDPVNCDIYNMYTKMGAHLYPLPVDGHGMEIDLLDPIGSLRLIFTTPSHQFPMGSILSIERRLKLIDLAQASDAYIIEDDYDSAFRFTGTPVSALHSLKPDRVIYTGTFSKMLFPALRIGYVLLPKALVKDFVGLKHLEDLHTPILEQLTLARFIEEGYLDRHIYKCRKVYKDKNAYLKACLIEAFGQGISILGDSAGLHLVVAFEEELFLEGDYRMLQELGLNISPIFPHTQFPNAHRNELMIGYGHLTMEAIARGVKILSTYIEGRGQAMT